MAGSFGFGLDSFLTDDFVPWTIFSTGDASGWINDPAQFSATATGGIDGPNDRDILAIALFGGQTVTFDIDNGIADVDTTLSLVDSAGRLVAASESGGAVDPGSISGLDPLLTFTASATGLYFLAVTASNDDYVGSFSFSGGAEDTGTYTLNVSTPSLRPLALGSDDPGAPDNLSLTDLPDRIDLRAGDDTANLGGGNDIAHGDEGDDTIRGGNGDDIVSGGLDADELIGGNGNDVLLTGTFDLSADILSGDAGDDRLFGSGDADTLRGGDDNDLLWGDIGGDVLDGGAGFDTLSYGGDGVPVTVNLGTNTASGGAADGDTIARFENVIGSTGGDTLRGSAVTNVLDGSAGDDVLVGDGGNDTLIGGRGADSMDGGAGIDTISYEQSESPVFADLGANTFGGEDGAGDFAVNVENVAGSRGHDVLTGNNAANRLAGLDGDDSLDGGAGTDTLLGGLGDDVYRITAGDVVIELAGQGTDRIDSPFSLTLGANLERLRLLGTGNLNGTGNSLVNALTGNAGRNILDGKAGADAMSGGGGNDTYIVDNPGDQLGEAAGEGVDTVLQSISSAGPLAANVENVTLTGGASIDATGNALANRIIGNSGNNRIDGGGGPDTLSGRAGNDTYLVSDTLDAITELAGEGIDLVLVVSNVSITLPVNVENLTISYPFAPLDATGNALANTLIGNAHANVLDGKAGADTMIGGDGADVYVVDDAGDVVTELANQGSDAIQSTISRSLAANVETLILLGSANIDGTGNALANTLFGNGGNNVLDGGGAGDILEGSVGNDTYIADAADFVNEFAGQGIDTVRTGVNRGALEAHVENLVLTGGANIAGTGNGLDNALTGNAGHNLLDGGAGDDTMRGGAGNDTYVVDDAGDVVIENAGQGLDTVQSSVSETLAANVENLVLLDGLNPDNPLNINGSGNALANTLTGNRGHNILDGKGGADTMRGGEGDDTYRVDHAGDTVVESSGFGEDTVEASVSFTLAANVDNLTLTGAGDLIATGNSRGNLLVGNAGNNILDGKTNGDTMAGGDGNDTYMVDHLGDEIVEGSGKGTDRVQSSVSLTLSTNVEHLTLTGNGGIAGTGNALANTITGNGGSNVIAGKGGHDTLRGGAGADFFLFDTPPSIASNLDTVADFNAVADTFRLDQTVFAVLGLGVLSADAFIKASAAADAEDRIIYNAANQTLFYDRDGIAAAAAVAFARLSGNQSALSNSDFVVVA